MIPPQCNGYGRSNGREPAGWFPLGPALSSGGDSGVLGRKKGKEKRRDKQATIVQMGMGMSGGGRGTRGQGGGSRFPLCLFGFVSCWLLGYGYREHSVRVGKVDAETSVWFWPLRSPSMGQCAAVNVNHFRDSKH